MWIVYAFGAAFCFTLCNAAISEITSKVGPLCIFYFASGSILCGAVYNILQSYKNYLTKGKIWNDQNIVVDGKLSQRNLLGFIVYCLNYFMIQNLAFLTMYFAAKAKINVGVITTIWSINPLFMAFADYMIYG